MTKHPLFPGNIPAGGSFKFSGASRNGDLDPTPSDFLPESEVFRGYALIQSNLAIAHELRTANLQRERDWTRNRPSSSENDLSPDDFTDRIYKSLGVENQETLRRSGVSQDHDHSSESEDMIQGQANRRANLEEWDEVIPRDTNYQILVAHQYLPLQDRCKCRKSILGHDMHLNHLAKVLAETHVTREGVNSVFIKASKKWSGNQSVQEAIGYMAAGVADENPGR